MVVKVPIEVTQTGTGLVATVKGLEEVEKKAKSANDAAKGFGSGMLSSTQRAGAFADSMGRVSTTLARSADAFGLPAGALRSLDDVADVAELGLRGLEQGALKSAVSFKSMHLAMLGPIAAAAAIGAAIGGLLNKFKAVRDAADALLGPLFRLVGLAGSIDKSATQGLGEFSKQMAASNEGAIAKQVASMREMGNTTKEIADFYKGRLNPELERRLGLTKEAVKAEEQVLKAHQRQKAELQQMPKERGGPVAPLRSSTSVDVTAKGGDLMGQLMGGGLATSIGTLPKSMAEAAKATTDWSGQLADLANIMQGSGGLLGKLGGLLGALGSGISGLGAALKGLRAGAGGGLGKGVGGFLDKLGGGVVGKIAGALGKAVPFVSAALSVVSIGKSLFGGIKSLFGGKSKEQKAAEAEALKKAEADRKAVEDEKKRVQIEGLKSARSAAESLMGRMEGGGFSEKLTGALNTLVGKVQDALLKSGLAGMTTGPLRESKAFGAAQGAATDVAEILKGMREAGALDAGLLGAAATSAEELRAQATAAATEAGLAPAEATKAGFAAIAPLLREQLNASLASGQELDANTKAMIEEAKKNGVSILADPMVESVAVQREMLKELGRIGHAGGGGGVPGGRGGAPPDSGEDSRGRPDAGYASGTRGLMTVKSDMLAKIHAGEGLLVVPRDEMGRTAFASFQEGTPSAFKTDTSTTFTGDVSEVVTALNAAVAGAFGGLQAGIEAAIGNIQPMNITNAPQVQIVDQSVVRTVEGQKRFEAETVGAIERALDQNSRGLESRIERIARRVE